MNNTLFLLLAMFFCCCESKGSDAPYLTVESTAQLVFSQMANSRRISCSSNAKIEASSSQLSWCQATVVDNDKAIVIYASPNDVVGRDRTATVTITAGAAEPVRIEVKQGSQEAVFSVEGNAEQQLDWKTAQRSLKVQANIDVTVLSSEPSWCTAEVLNSGSRSIIINVAENFSGAERTADVTVAAPGFDNVKIKIAQDYFGRKFNTFDIKVGVNLSQWFLESNQRTYVSRADLENIAGLGFDHVRIPMGEYVMFDAYSNQKREDTFDLVKNVLGWCEELNLRVIFDYHSLKEGEKIALHGTSVRERFYANWLTISGELKRYPNNFLAYEILNEMTGDAATWNTIAKACIQAIRELEPARMLVLGGVNWNDRSTVNQLDLPSNDPNIILTFHQYWPMVLTHYKASWGSPMTFPVKYPGQTVATADLPTAIAEVGSDMATTWSNPTVNRDVMKGWLTAAVNFAKSKNLKLWCGEYGCIGWAPKESRVNWLRDSASIYDELGIAHCIWEYAPRADGNDSFTIYYNGTARTDEINAILDR